MFFDIKHDQKPLIKNVLNIIETNNPQSITEMEINESEAKLAFLIEQLCFFEFIERVELRWFLTFDGKDLLNKLM